MDFVNNPKSTPDVPVEKPKYFRVQLGAYSSKERGYNAQQEIFNKIGWKAYVTYIQPYWKLQFGAYVNKSGAESIKAQLKGFGYNSFITYY